VDFHPIDNEAFTQSFANCAGVLCGAGFELPAEAMFLNKKLMVIPMIGQYEQHCNAVAARNMGATMIDGLDLLHHRMINLWLNQGASIKVNYADQTESIVQTTLADFERKHRLLKAPRLTDEKTVFEKLSVLKYLF
jgi:hypothetical protein